MEGRRRSTHSSSTGAGSPVETTSSDRHALASLIQRRSGRWRRLLWEWRVDRPGRWRPVLRLAKCVARERVGVRWRIQIALVESVVTTQIADVSAESAVDGATPIGFASAADIQLRLVPIVEIDVCIVHIIDHVGIGIEQIAGTAARQAAGQYQSRDGNATNHPDSNLKGTWFDKRASQSHRPVQGSDLNGSHDRKERLVRRMVGADRFTGAL